MEIKQWYGRPNRGLRLLSGTDLQLKATGIQQLHERCVRLASVAKRVGRHERQLAVLGHLERQLVALRQHRLAIHQDM